MSAVWPSKGIWVDVAIWHGLSLAFLGVYGFIFDAPAIALAAHLSIVLLAYVGITALRITLRLLLPEGLRTAQLVRAVLCVVYAHWLLFLLMFYGATLLWIHTNGRLLGWEMALVFFRQSGHYLKALELPITALIAGLVVLYLVCLGLAWLHLRRHDWTPGPGLVARKYQAAALMLGLVAACAATNAVLVTRLPAVYLEPFGITFKPGAISPRLGHSQSDSAAMPSTSDSELAIFQDYQPSPQATRRNLVVIVVDALRPDHMGAYGYERATTPYINKLLQHEVSRRVEGVRAVCGQSECGLRGMFSSRYVHQFSSRMFNLTDVMRRHGYKIHMILSGDHRNFYGLRESYGEPDTYFDGTMAASQGDYVNGHKFLISRLQSIAPYGGSPTLFQFHVMATHPFGAHPERPQPYQPAENYSMHWRRTVLNDPAARLQTAVNFYDNAVVEADAIVKQLLDVLKAKGYLEGALVVLTADHGEALGEHGTYTHAQNTFEQALRIPLIFFSFGGKPISTFDTERHFSQVDIVPTLVTELGMPLAASWSGMPMQRKGTRRLTFFEEREDVGLIEQEATGRLWKFWRNSITGQEFAFAINEDPHELRNLIAQTPRGKVRQWRAEIASGRNFAADEPPQTKPRMNRDAQ